MKDTAKVKFAEERRKEFEERELEKRRRKDERKAEKKAEQGNKDATAAEVRDKADVRERTTKESGVKADEKKVKK